MMYKFSKLFLLLLVASIHPLSIADVQSNTVGATKKELIGYEPVVLKDAMPHIKFKNKIDPVFSPNFFNDLRAKIQAAGDYKNLIIETVGHGDNDKLSAATRAKFGSNKGLSKARAVAAGEAIKNKTNFADVTFKSDGKGGSQPIADNATQKGRAKNRRVEVNIYYSKPKYKTVVSSVSTTNSSSVPIVSPALSTASQDKAREALAAPEDGGDDTLEEALTAVDENYTLVGKSKFNLQYGYGFSYSAGDSIVTDANNNFLGVVQDGRATHSNRLSVNYGLYKNLSLGLSLPLVSTSTLGKRIKEDGIGDMSLSARWQPWAVRPGKPNLSLSFGLSLPTGTSPYDIDTSNTLPTGSGAYAYSLSANINKLIDPVVVYGGLSYSQSMGVDGLSQERFGRTLTAIKPAGSFGYNVGMGYALTYGVSLNTGFSHSFGSSTEFEFSDGTAEAFGGHSASYTVGAGFRTSPGTVINVSLGMGLTRESPDFSIGFSVPFSIEGMKSYFSK